VIEPLASKSTRALFDAPNIDGKLSMQSTLLTGDPDQAPVLERGHTFRSVTEKIGGIVLDKRNRLAWMAGFTICFLLLMMLLFAVCFLFAIGVGIWGVGIPVAWGFAIVNFVWWIGIGHAGTLISAILLLLHQKWRTSINRTAEAMTIFAVMCAGMFPLLHLGRPWLFYWLFPYPNTMWYWPQFRSPLVWDVFAVSTYLTVSLLFWYTGLVPDFASLRDRAKNWFQRFAYGTFALGWRGSAVHWKRYEVASILLAGLATPLVVSVHTVVSFDFTIAILPGWHSTIFPPYFVAGAIYSGFAMVLCLMIPMRWAYHLEDMITMRHLNLMAQVMLATGTVVAYGYIMEAFMAFFSADRFEIYATANRSTGPYAAAYWCLIAFNVIIPQALWSKRVRSSVPLIFLEAFLINCAMWLERFVIIITSLHRDFMPSAWRMYAPTRWDWMILWGSIGLFLTLFYLFIRFLPMISIYEMRELVAEVEGHK
jgi:Ni/Fe-hydrogenase subunit HybB-like protein